MKQYIENLTKRFLHFLPLLFLATHQVDYMKDTDDTHEIGLSVQLVYEAGGPAIVELTREDVAISEVRSG